MTDAARYAVYLAPPPGSDLHRVGSSLLGRDAATGEDLPLPPLAGIAAVRWREIVREARGYGFHGTLKPPFRLAAGRKAAELQHAVEALAAELQAFHAPPLVLRPISGFLALVPASPDSRIDALAARCVEALDGFRAPPDAAELERRRRAGLTPRQEALLQRWGYPYVMEEFRLHFTLSARLAEPERTAAAAALEPHVAQFATAPLAVDALTLFEQPEPGGPFRSRRRFPLRPAAT